MSVSTNSKFIEGLKVIREEYNRLCSKPNSNDYDLMQLHHETRELGIPQEYKDISASELNELYDQLRMHSYIEASLINMMLRLRTKKIFVTVMTEDKDISLKLVNHWETKGFKVCQSMLQSEVGTIYEIEW